MTVPAPGRRTLLLVDADPALRTVAQLHLGCAGYAILEASSEGAAFVLLRSARIDAAVCALKRPRLDVAACLRRLREAADPALRDVPVLLLAEGQPHDDVDALCAAHPPATALRAPHTGPRLAAAVERLLAR